MRNADLDHPFYQEWRPQNTDWDIGPLEWNEPAPVPPTPPSGRSAAYTQSHVAMAGNIGIGSF